MEQRGYVSVSDEKLARVIIQRESACGHSCSSCGGVTNCYQKRIQKCA